jgi:hypothetical protein
LRTALFWALGACLSDEEVGFGTEMGVRFETRCADGIIFSDRQHRFEIGAVELSTEFDRTRGDRLPSGASLKFGGI